MKAFIPLCLLLLLSSQARAVEVLASIKPLQLIASAITQGGTEPQLLLSPGSSPHDYALRPSDIRRINNADLVLWVGPDLEVFLAPIFERNNYKKNGHINLELMALLNADDHAHQEHDNETHHHDAAQPEHSTLSEPHHNTDKIIIEDQSHEETDEHHHHDHGSQDPHIWLDPHNAATIAQLLAEQLMRLDPNNIDRYQANLDTFKAGLAIADQNIAAQLAPFSGVGYFVFHDAYGYWERHYQLPALGYFTVNPARAPGAKTVASIHQALKQSKAQCVFAEPQFKPAVVNAVLRNTQARVGILDPLGTDIDVGPASYFAFMQQLADAMTNCLRNKY